MAKLLTDSATSLLREATLLAEEETSVGGNFLRVYSKVYRDATLLRLVVEDLESLGYSDAAESLRKYYFSE